MARKKRHSKVRHHRRKKVGAINGLDFEMLGLAVAGAVGAKLITNHLATSTNATILKFGAYIPLAVGIVLPLVVKNQMVKDISVGLVAGGGITALGSSGLKVISGFGDSIGNLPGNANYISNNRRALRINGAPGSNFPSIGNLKSIGAINEACNG